MPPVFEPIPLYVLASRENQYYFPTDLGQSQVSYQFWPSEPDPVPEAILVPEAEIVPEANIVPGARTVPRARTVPKAKLVPEAIFGPTKAVFGPLKAVFGPLRAVCGPFRAVFGPPRAAFGPYVPDVVIYAQDVVPMLEFLINLTAHHRHSAKQNIINGLILFSVAFMSPIICLSSQLDGDGDIGA